MRLGSPQVARRLRHHRRAAHPQWHLDEMFGSISGKRMYLWRAIDQNGEILDVLAQAKRNKHAGLRVMRKLLMKTKRAPLVLVTDKLRSYAAAFRAWVYRSATTEHVGRTTELKDPVCTSEDENGGCKGFARLGLRSDSSRCTLPLTTYSIRADIFAPLPIAAIEDNEPSISGTMRHRPPPRIEMRPQSNSASFRFMTQQSCGHRQST